MLIHAFVFVAGLWFTRALCCPPLFTPRERRAVTLGVLVASPVAGGWWWLVPGLAAGSVLVVWWGQPR